MKALKEIIEKNPELILKISTPDIRELARICIEEGRSQMAATAPDEYMTPKQYAEALHVSLVTLWTWDKQGITRPYHIGARKLYKRSDLEKIMIR